MDEYKYHVYHLQDDTYQVILYTNKNTDKELWDVMYQGKLSDCEAWINLHKQEMIG